MTGAPFASPVLTQILASIYPRADRRVREGRHDSAAALAAVRDYVRSDLPDCVLALVHGSVLKGGARSCSDLDVLAVRSGFGAIGKRSLVHDGHYIDLVEADSDQLERLLDSDRATGNDWIVSALATGEPVVDRWARTGRLRAAAAALLESGPEPARRQEIDVLRATITGQVSSLCRCASDSQRLVVGLGLFAPLASLILKQQGSWSHRGKHLADFLDKAAPGMNPRLRDSYEDLLAGRPETLALLARDVLAPSGGWLAEGFSNARPLKPVPARP